MSFAELAEGFARPGVIYQEPRDPRPPLKLYQVWECSDGWVGEVVFVDPHGLEPYATLRCREGGYCQVSLVPASPLPPRMPLTWTCLVDVASSPEEPAPPPEPPPLVTETCHVCGLRFKTPELSRILCDYHLERATAALAKKAEWFEKRAADRRVAEKMYFCDVEKALVISPVRTDTVLPIERMRPACDLKNVWMMGPWR